MALLVMPILIIPLLGDEVLMSELKHHFSIVPRSVPTALDSIICPIAGFDMSNDMIHGTTRIARSASSTVLGSVGGGSGAGKMIFESIPPAFSTTGVMTNASHVFMPFSFTVTGLGVSD